MSKTRVVALSVLLVLLCIVAQGRKVRVEDETPHINAARKLIAKGAYKEALTKLPSSKQRRHSGRIEGLRRACTAMEGVKSGNEATDLMITSIEAGDTHKAIELGRIAGIVFQDTEPAALFKIGGFLKDEWELEAMHAVLARRTEILRGKPATRLEIPRSPSVWKHAMTK